MDQGISFAVLETCAAYQLDCVYLRQNVEFRQKVLSGATAKKRKLVKYLWAPEEKK